MSKSEQKSGTYAETVTALTVAHRAVANSEADGSRKMEAAGLALIAALEKGAVTFDRVTGEALTALRANGVMTKSDLAKHLGTSGTMLTKYASVGIAVCVGIDHHTVGRDDWLTFTRAAASAWVTEAVATADPDVIRKAIADHRPGAGKSTQTNGQTKGKGKKAAKPKDTKAAPANVTARTVEADVTRVTTWLTQHPGAVKGESRETIIALLREAADAVEAAGHKAAGKAEAPVAKVA